MWEPLRGRRTAVQIANTGLVCFCPHNPGFHFYPGLKNLALQNHPEFLLSHLHLVYSLECQTNVILHAMNRMAIANHLQMPLLLILEILS